MENGNGNTIVHGTSLSSLLTVLFVALKLTGVISWSWWWVVSPIWISWLLALAIFVFGVAILTYLKVTDRKS